MSPFANHALAYRAKLNVEPIEQGGFLVGRPQIDTVFKGMRMRAVGSTIYSRPFGETFHQFLIWHLMQYLDAKWVDTELGKDADERSLLADWVNQYKETSRKMDETKPTEIIHAVPQDANLRHLLSLAYDFYSLAHCNAKILPKLINRLKKRGQFQGARFEIAVGGIVARAGFEIQWVNESGKHCEFVGVHRVTKDKAAFEAKSHHRAGVLGQPGDFDVESTKTKIWDHVREALEQSSKDTPLVIFDDLNLPITSDLAMQEKAWFKEINDTLEDVGFFDKQDRKNYSALFITNFSWHFHSDLSEIRNRSSEALSFFTANGPFSLKMQTLQLLQASAEQYGSIPPRSDELAAITAEIEHAKKHAQSR